MAFDFQLNSGAFFATHLQYFDVNTFTNANCCGRFDDRMVSDFIHDETLSALAQYGYGSVFDMVILAVH